MSSKSILIGLDGAEPTLLKEWSDQGFLPNFAKLFDEYFCIPIDSPRGFGDGGLWSSLVTGVNPGKHGHYFPSQFNSQTYMLDQYSIDTDLRRDPFWYLCSKMGRTVGVIDIYTSPLRTGLNGIQVMDWMIHDRMGEPRSWPASLIDQLHERYMPDPLLGNTESVERTDGEHLRLHQDILDRIEAKTTACEDLLKNNQWDLFCVGYCDAHDVGHQSWHWHDESCDDHPAHLVSKYGNPLLQTYQALDDALGRLLPSADAQNVYLVAGLGMGKQSLCNAGLQQVLAHYSGFNGNRDEVIQQRKSMPYFELPHNMHGGAVRINLQGRELLGMVAEQDYQTVCDELASRLSTLGDADSGELLVKEVVQVRQSCPGDHQNNLPDLLVVWNKPLSVKTIRVDESTCIDLSPTYSFEHRSGDHSDRALFLSTQKFQQDRVAAEAIAPTICVSLGVNLPETDAPALCKI